MEFLKGKETPDFEKMVDHLDTMNAVVGTFITPASRQMAIRSALIAARDMLRAAQLDWEN